MGKTLPGAVLMSPPVMVTGDRPQIGFSVILLQQPWAVVGPGMRAVWYSVISTFRVDGYGISRLGAGHDMTEWVSLRTQEGDRIYRKSRSGRHLADGDPPPDPEWVEPPGDLRWPLTLLTEPTPAG